MMIVRKNERHGGRSTRAAGQRTSRRSLVFSTWCTWCTFSTWCSFSTCCTFSMVHKLHMVHMGMAIES